MIIYTDFQHWRLVNLKILRCAFEAFSSNFEKKSGLQTREWSEWMDVSFDTFFVEFFSGDILIDSPEAARIFRPQVARAPTMSANAPITLYCAILFRLYKTDWGEHIFVFARRYAFVNWEIIARLKDNFI